MYSKHSDTKYEAVKIEDWYEIVSSTEGTLCSMLSLQDAQIYIDLLERYDTLLDKYYRACC